jgi:hypothetical protein
MLSRSALGAPNTSSIQSSCEERSPIMRDAGSAGKCMQGALMRNAIALSAYLTVTTYVASRYKKVVSICRKCGSLILLDRMQYMSLSLHQP